MSLLFLMEDTIEISSNGIRVKKGMRLHKETFELKRSITIVKSIESISFYLTVQTV